MKIKIAIVSLFIGLVVGFLLKPTVSQPPVVQEVEKIVTKTVTTTAKDGTVTKTKETVKNKTVDKPVLVPKADWSLGVETRVDLDFKPSYSFEISHRIDGNLWVVGGVQVKEKRIDGAIIGVRYEF